jgi:hypothetical protein
VALGNLALFVWKECWKEAPEGAQKETQEEAQGEAQEEAQEEAPATQGTDPGAADAHSINQQNEP